MSDNNSLRNAITLLRNAFIDRPVPAGHPFDDLDDPRELLDRFCEAMRLIVPCLRQFWRAIYRGFAEGCRGLSRTLEPSFPGGIGAGAGSLRRCDGETAADLAETPGACAGAGPRLR